MSSSLPAHPTHAANLAELSIFTWQDLEQVGQDPGDTAVVGREEFQRMLAWRAARTGRRPMREASDTPSGVAFPVASGGRDSRCGVGWVDAVPLSEVVARGAAIDVSVLLAFDTARSWLAFRSIGSTYLAAQVMAPPDVEGCSGGLAALIACLARSIGFQVPEDLAATGCLTTEVGEVQITSVQEDTIEAKVEALRRHGFRRILIPADQQSRFDSCIDPDEEITLIPLPKRATAALPAILKILVGGVITTEPLVQALLLLDKVCVRSPEGIDRAFPKELVREISRGADPIVRVIAADISARRATHHGDARAVRFDRYVDRVMESQSIPIADPWLADYFNSHRIASRAMLALDAGDWNQRGESPVWQALEREIDELKDRHGRNARRFINIRDRYSLFACLNTRAFLKVFRGRACQDQALILSGLEDRVALWDEWDLLMRFGAELGHDDCTRERQQNYVIDAIAAASALGDLTPMAIEAANRLRGELPAELSLPESRQGRDTSFRVLYLWKWARFERNSGLDGAFADWLDRRCASGRPLSFLDQFPVEQLAAFHSDRVVRESAAELLKSQAWFSEKQDPRSIKWVLRLRTLAAVELAFGETGVPASLRAIVRAAPAGPLREIGEQVIASDLTGVMARSPY